MRLAKQVTAVILVLVAAGCASSTSTTSSSETFGNFLILGIADDYEGRARYERLVASKLRQKDVNATAYHDAVGGKDDVSREKARELIAERGFDAVLVTHVRNSKASYEVSQDSADTKITRKNNSAVDFFRYDYEELTEPGEMSLLAEAALDTNLHRASDGSVIWSNSWSSKSAENVGILVDQASDDIVRRLERAKLLAR